MKLKMYSVNVAECKVMHGNRAIVLCPYVAFPYPTISYLLHAHALRMGRCGSRYRDADS